MGVLSRLGIVIKSFLGATADRIDRIAAEEELRAAKASKDAADELDSALKADHLKNPIIDTQPRTIIESGNLAEDYRLLGIRPNADLQAVENAWRELARRADPKRFPSGSDEEKRAAEILKSINGAYARIREAINPTEGRFGRLEL